jgi:hypothetical protein
LSFGHLRVKNWHLHAAKKKSEKYHFIFFTAFNFIADSFDFLMSYFEKKNFGTI